MRSLRVIIANKFWYSRGGQERVALDEARWLEEMGHTVAHFSTAHPETEETPWLPYFAPYLELGRPDELSPADRVRAAVRLFHNIEAKSHFAKLLSDFQPDLIHIHGIARQISPSILSVAHVAGIPVVQTIHDYHHICASGDLMRGGCEICVPPACSPTNPLPALVHACRQDSRAVSLLLAAETSSAQLLRSYDRAIVRYISPSKFLADMHLNAGWTNKPIDVVANGSDAGGVPREAGAAGQGFVFAGRLSREKGVGVLLEAAERAKLELTVIGDGPEAAQAKRVASPRVSFPGHLSTGRVQSALRSSRAAVVPSVWLENLPMSVIEPMLLGVPVIASNMGGIPEMVRNGIDGFLVQPGDVDALARAMRELEMKPELSVEMGQNARSRALSLFTREAHMSRLLEVYAMAGSGRR